ncbi:MAG TPA: hypothetical protein VME70_05055 [Mycobacteriales bacterium]|nr:hypothetical protein [Mycobacteriales bacterium]
MTRRITRSSKLVLVLAMGLLGSTLGSMPAAFAASPHWVVVKAGATGRLNAVSCASPTNCMAVGANSGGAADVARWNGHHWTTTTPAFPAGAYLDGVSCVSKKFCMVVGIVTGGPLAEKWNGTSWTEVTAANPQSTAALKAVSCPSAKDCWAVGAIDGNATLAEHWTGKQFTIVSTVTVGKLDYLNGVSCHGSMCMAVGGGTKGALLERSTGKKFTRVKAGHTAKGYTADMWSVSCPTSKECIAVGEQDSSKAYKTLTEVYRKGRFTTVISPNPTHLAFPYNTLLAVSCVSSKDCWANGQGGAFSFAGAHPTSKDRSTIAAKWNGHSWHVARSVNPGNHPSGFVGGSCASSKHCFAVGNQPGATGHALIEKLVG